MNSGQETHFGFQTVKSDQKEGLVRGVFDSVAQRYDIMNDVMSVGIHRVWKNSLIDQLNPRPGMKLLDVAGGTGDIAFRFLNKLRSENDPINQGQVKICDINPSMLQVGKDRALDQGYLKEISWICGDAEKLPIEDQSVDAYTIAFGIRNVTNIYNAIKEAYRVLRPGGHFLCLEFSHIPQKDIAKFYDWYSFNIIPHMGEIITNDRESYKYLVESIRNFPTQEKFKGMIKDAGFKRVTYRNLSGGIVATHSGRRI
ncbi:MAG: bifunctional demethylmenaquinone methyltransferase/2-methoxy-6-polyprenyl-1,4-benzoquinol methylase UbiE [Sphingomonadales bacterium]